MASILLSILISLLTILSSLTSVYPQSSSPTSTLNLSSSASYSISSYTTSLSSISGTQTVVYPSVINITYVPLPTSSGNSSVNETASSKPSPLTLDTQLDPAFGVLGGILIVTGLPSAFLGHKNRWSSFFLIGFYTLSAACLALILKYGVLTAINPPNQVLRGVFVLACGVAGVAGGGIAIFFWRQTKYFIGAWGGFAIGLWIQCFRDGGLIRPIGFRWILYIVLGVIGFVLCTIPRLHYHVLLISTAVVGASAFILGIDCFTTANLKEFYVYNLGFDSLFATYLNAGVEFPVTQLMEVELGLIGAVAIMGAAIQWRILRVLRYKLKEINSEQKRQDQVLEAQAAATFSGVITDLQDWEKKHGRQDSHFSDTALMKDKNLDIFGTDSQHTLSVADRRARRPSSLSDFLSTPGTLEDESGRPYDKRQSIGVLPAIDLGNDIEEELPSDFIETLDKPEIKSPPTAEELDDLKRQEELLSEIQNIRRSIEILRAESPSKSILSESQNASRHQSFTSRRTLSLDFATLMEGGPSHDRPPRVPAPRTRVRSMDGLTALSHGAELRSSSEEMLRNPDERRTSKYSLGENWETYLSERKLFQPPSGVTVPIIAATSFHPSQYLNLPNISSDTSSPRHSKKKLHSKEATPPGSTFPDAVLDSYIKPANPFIQSTSNKEFISRNSYAPITILPPVKPQPEAPAIQRFSSHHVKTFEELTERHRERLHNLQAPLTRVEKEEAELQAARNRWEKSKEAEKQAMSRREAKKHEKVSSRVMHGRPEKPSVNPLQQRNPSLSHDQISRLNNTAMHSKRQSLMKVEDWQSYQQNVETRLNRDQRYKHDSDVPFPQSATEFQPGRSTAGARTGR